MQKKLCLAHTLQAPTNDIQKATHFARAMVTKWGMSEKLGTINYSENTDNFFGIKSYSESTEILMMKSTPLLVPSWPEQKTFNRQ